MRPTGLCRREGHVLAFTTRHRERRDDLVSDLQGRVELRPSEGRPGREARAEGNDLADEFVAADESAEAGETSSK